MPPRQQQIQQRLALILGDVVPVPLRKRQQTLMPDNGQFPRATQIASDRLGAIHGGIRGARAGGSEAQEVEDEGVDDLEGERVLLLQQGLDEDVAGAGGVRVAGHLVGGDFAQAVERGGRVQHGDGDLGDDRGDDGGFALGAAGLCQQGEYDAFEERGGFVERLLQRVVQVDVEFLGVGDVGLDRGEEHRVEEELRVVRLGRDEDARGRVHGVWRPVLGACDGEEGFPGGDCGEDLEGLGEFAGFVAREDEADFAVD